ncbi:hypothetical protein AMP9_1961 [plant metagenome]|uniref:Uncharacterized protein n=1 Tax=plant metagenome TaxID=1297885 RepID=A0A484PIM2_9ZZZZ
MTKLERFHGTDAFALHTMNHWNHVLEILLDKRKLFWRCSFQVPDHAGDVLADWLE